MTAAIQVSELCTARGAGPEVAAGYRWEVPRGAAAIDRLAPAWNALARQNALAPTADALWMRCFWRAFGGDDDELHIHALRRGDELVCALPLRRTGRLVRTWSSIANGHTPYVQYATGGDVSVVARQILDHLLESADVLDLERFPANGPLCRALVAEAERRGLPMAEEARPGDSYIRLFGPWEAFRRSLPAKLEHDSVRQRRRLQRLGKLTLDVLDGGMQLEQGLATCFELETRGWKGQRGSPIIAKPQTRQFYTELAHAAAVVGRMALYILSCDGQPIAFEYCLRGDGQIDLLKISYDPAWATYSPGNVLRHWLFERETERGEIATYRFGPESEWKRRWTQQVDALVRLRIYRRNSKGRLAHLAGPRLRNRLKRWEGLRNVVAAARKAGLPI